MRMNNQIYKRVVFLGKCYVCRTVFGLYGISQKKKLGRNRIFTLNIENRKLKKTCKIEYNKSIKTEIDKTYKSQEVLSWIMFLTDRKLDRRVSEAKNYRYRNAIPMEQFAMCEDEQGVVNPVVPTSFENWNTIKTGDCWSGRDRYLWLHKEVHIPEEWKGQRESSVFLTLETPEQETTQALRQCAILMRSHTRVWT